MIVMSLTGLYSLVSHSQKIDIENEDIYIAAKQISQEVIGTCYLSVGESYSYLSLDGKEMLFTLDAQRLVKKDGFEIFLFDVGEVEFMIENDCIFMLITRGDDDYKFLLTYAKEKEEIEDEDQDIIE